MLRKKMLLGNSIAENPIPPMDASAIIRIPGIKESKLVDIGFSIQSLQMHVLLMGGTGAGKTNTIKHLIFQIQKAMTSEDVMLVFDTKLDFDIFHRSDDYVISYRNECIGALQTWNLFRELIADGWDKEAISANADELADVIFSQAIQESSQPFFPKAARDVFSAVIKGMTYLGIDDKQYRIKYMNNRALYQYLIKLDAEKLSDFLGPIEELSGVLKYIGSGNSDQALGVFAELQSVVGKIFSRGFGKDGRFSVRDAVKKRSGKTLFIEYDVSNGKSLQPVYRLLVDLFLKESLNVEKKSKGNVFIICDELKLLPHLQHFEDALNFGRSLGVSVIAGIQSMQQLYEVYGEYGGKNIAAAFQNVLCFRTKDEESRHYLKSIYGQNMSVIQYMLPSGETCEEKYVGYCVEDWEIVSLQCGEAVVGISDYSPFKMQILKFRR